MRSIRILLAEDVHLIRGTLVALLELEPDFQVVAAVDHGDAVVPTALASRPDVAVIGAGLRGHDGLVAAGRLHERVPRCRTLILTSLGAPGALRRAMAARVGGFLLKDAPPERLALAVRAVARGQRLIDPELARTAWESPGSPLSAQELTLLRCAARGGDTAAIAGRLRQSRRGVRIRLARIAAKLGARTDVESVRIAEEAGWIP
ncbi:DNA-binding response regulator [Streptomyces sp. NPDC050560]|uniref:DNA-binding response regulator n=1 Tax=Streptomyces sp. NPDC050560 TaxID=3365630 RepID=UPI0037A38465